VKIDNTLLSPREAAEIIVEQFSLPVMEERQEAGK
jgi:hypothetical protein